MTTTTINTELSKLFGIKVSKVSGYDVDILKSGGAYYSSFSKEIFYSEILELGCRKMLSFILYHELGHHLFGEDEDTADTYAESMTGYSAKGFRENYDFNSFPYREYMEQRHPEGERGLASDLLCLEIGLDPRPVFGPEPHPLDCYSQYLDDTYGYPTMRICLENGLTEEEIREEFESYIS